MENQSRFDPTRKTVGATYLDAQKAPHDVSIQNGDLTNELMKSLVDDLNDAIKSQPFGDRTFYVTVHEKKDITMPRAIKRVLYNSLYRPYPEDDTIVFKIFPTSNTVKFCWCLPHRDEMDNFLMNEFMFDKEFIMRIKAWMNNKLEYFGFFKDFDEHWWENDKFEDSKMEHKSKLLIPS